MILVQLLSLTIGAPLTDTWIRPQRTLKRAPVSYLLDSNVFSAIRREPGLSRGAAGMSETCRSSRDFPRSRFSLRRSQVGDYFALLLPTLTNAMKKMRSRPPSMHPATTRSSCRVDRSYAIENRPVWALENEARAISTHARQTQSAETGQTWSGKSGLSSTRTKAAVSLFYAVVIPSVLIEKDFVQRGSPG